MFIPGADEVYPAGFVTYVDPAGPLTQRLEAASRHGHFRGVATVVAKLFNLARPDRAYFGQKDAQQVAVLRRMVTDLNFPLALRVLPTIREADGLAMSSRNSYLGAGGSRRRDGALPRAGWPAWRRSRRVRRAAWRRCARLSAEVGAEPRATLDYADVAIPTASSR